MIFLYYGLPWCFHKEGETWEITRLMDPVRVFLCECGGVRTEKWS